jgi:hypothetical protein
MQREERVAIVVAKGRGKLIVGAPPRDQITDTYGYLLSIPVYKALSLALGHLVILTRPDNVVRRPVVDQW